LTGWATNRLRGTVQRSFSQSYVDSMFTSTVVKV